VAETPLALEVKHSQVDLREVTLHWTEVGRGPPVLLLHGLNDSHRTWRAIYPRLPGRRILMLDLPGHGMSSRPDAPYTLDWNATQLARFIEHLDLRNLDLVGHSYGGGVAQWLLLKCRPRIRRVALLAAGGLGRDVYPWLRLASVPFLIEAFGQRWMGPIAGFAMARATTSDAAAELALLTTYLRQPGSARAFSRTVRDVIRWRGQTRNLFDRIAEIEELPPMRLFWGARDTILPISQGTAIAARLENCELIRFADRGHFLHWEEPEGVAGALRNFLDSLDAPPVRVKPHATRSSISGREIAPPRRFRLGAIERRRRLASDSPDARRAPTSSASRLGQCQHPKLAPHGLLARIKNITGR
jgi:pimeloyl-ACP methyl ester carboxylesterase